MSNAKKEKLKEIEEKKLKELEEVIADKEHLDDDEFEEFADKAWEKIEKKWGAKKVKEGALS